MDLPLTRRSLLGAGATAAAAGVVGYTQFRRRRLWSANPYPQGGRLRFLQFVDGRLFATADDCVVELDPDSGAAEWVSPEIYPDDGLVFPPAIDGSDVIVGSNYQVVGYEAGTDDPRWRFEDDDLISPAIGSSDEFAFVGSGTGTGAFHCVDRSDGSGRWSKPLGALTTPPVCGPETVYVPVSGRVHALDFDGEPVWKSPDRGVSSLAHDDGTLFVVEEGAVRALDADSGRTRWKETISAGAPVVPGEDRVFAPSGDGDRGYAFDRETGVISWEFRPDPPNNMSDGREDGAASRIFEPRVQQPVYHDGTVYFEVWADRKTGLYAVDADSGEKRWRYGSPVSSAAVGNGRLYALTDDGRLHAVAFEPQFSL